MGLRGARLAAAAGAALAGLGLAAGAGYTPAAEADRVQALPGWGAPGFGLFSGYVTVDDAAGRALFYAFVETPGDPAAAPLVLWLNGGPGCSSLAGGFLSELGPFYPTTDGAALQGNKYSWTQAANVIFLESPAFVGFSYSNTSSDGNVGDNRTASDSRLFLLGFLERFPQYANHPFWIAGESYGGHYVPELAYEIVTHNDTKPAINLQGFLVGNAWTDPAIDNKGAVDYWWSHALISDATRAGLYQECDFSSIGPLTAAGEAAGETANVTFDSKETRSACLEQVGQNTLIVVAEKYVTPGTSQACDQLTSRAMEEMGSINIYDIFVDVCLPAPAAAEVLKFSQTVGATPRALAARVSERRYSKGMYDPCIDDEVETYLNRPDVQLAMHANTSRHRLPYRWTQCAGAPLNYSQKLNARLAHQGFQSGPQQMWGMRQNATPSKDDVLTSVLPVYEALLKTNLRMLVFSGDVDAIVPVVGSRRWVTSLGLPTMVTWRPWVSSTGQVGGYVQQYAGLVFATVRDAGHMVPYTQPERALYLFKSWIETAAMPGSGVLKFLGGSGVADDAQTNQ